MGVDFAFPFHAFPPLWRYLILANNAFHLCSYQQASLIIGCIEVTSWNKLKNLANGSHTKVHGTFLASLELLDEHVCGVQSPIFDFSD
jgi:hypothetical protein